MCSRVGAAEGLTRSSSAIRAGHVGAQRSQALGWRPIMWACAAGGRRTSCSAARVTKSLTAASGDFGDVGGQLLRHHGRGCFCRGENSRTHGTRQVCSGRGGTRARASGESSERARAQHTGGAGVRILSVSAVLEGKHPDHPNYLHEYTGQNSSGVQRMMQNRTKIIRRPAKRCARDFSDGPSGIWSTFCAA